MLNQLAQHPIRLRGDAGDGGPIPPANITAETDRPASPTASWHPHLPRAGHVPSGNSATTRQLASA